MGTLTYSEIEDEVRTSLGNRTDLDSRLTRLINLSQMRIARMRRWEELEKLYSLTLAVTSDPATDMLVAFESNFRDVYSVRLIDGTSSWKLTRKVYRTFDRSIANPSSIGRQKPVIYTVWCNTMELYPVQDQAYVLRARTVNWPTAFTGSAAPTQTSDFDQKDDIIIAGAVLAAYISLQDFGQMEKWGGQLANLLTEAFAEETERPDLDFTPSPGIDRDRVVEYWKDPFIRSISQL